MVDAWYELSCSTLHNEPNLGGQKELCENSKIKGLELIFTSIHIISGNMKKICHYKLSDVRVNVGPTHGDNL